MRPDTDPGMVRRLDWRFLLQDPALDRVSFVSPGDAELLRALQGGADSVVTGSPAELRSRPPARVTVVTPRGSEGLLAQAASLVPEGGWLYAELARGAVLRGRLRRTVRLLRRAGFGTVRPHWHWPSLEASKRIVPIDHSTGAHAPLRRQLGRDLRGLERVLEAVLRPGKAVELLGGSVSLLARRGNEAPSGWLSLEPLAADLRPALGMDAPSWTMLTPRFRASAHVLLLLARHDGEAPSLVAKIARLAGTDGALEREAANLRALEAAGMLADSVPRLVTTGATASGHALLVESGLAGRPLDPATVREQPARWIRLTSAWLGSLPSAADEDCAPIDAIVWDPLRRFAEQVPGRGSTNGRLVEETLAALEPLRTVRLPRVFEHGDLGHPNLLIEDGQLRVLDWEAGRTDGLPLHDLTFFLGYVAKAVGSLRSAQDHAPVFAQLLADPSSGAASALRGSAADLRLPPTLIGPLVLAAWARTVAGLASRVSGSPGAVDDWLGSNRYYLLWKDALRRQDDLGRVFR
jgi:hypothetical protein